MRLHEKINIRRREFRDAYLDGRSARRNGQPQSDNPHPIGTCKRGYWFDGWVGNNCRVPIPVEPN